MVEQNSIISSTTRLIAFLGIKTFEEKLILFRLDFEDIIDNKQIPISDLNVSFESNGVNVCPDAISKSFIIFSKNLLNNC